MRRTSAPLALCGCLVLAVGCAPSSGDTGTGGSNGTAGTTGSAGTGSPGSAGTTGTGGTSGDAGTTGSAGNGSGTSGTTGSAGSIATAGTTGTGGGAGSTGGSVGTGGRGGTTAGRGGTTGSAGVTGTAGTTGTGGSGSGNCTFTQSSALSTKIPTVGIVTWSTTMTGATTAAIDFGLTTSYGMTAPIATVQSSNRTLLLGMKTSRMYNYRITVNGSGGASCQSPNYTIMTGAIATGLMKPTLNPATATATGLSGGFLITGQYAGGAGAAQSAYIIDADGDFVWWYSIGSDVTGARMSYGGTHMWINSANVPGPNNQNVRRVTMDGMTEENLSSSFTGLNHQLTVLPDETVAFYAYGSNGCDDVKERSPTGTVKTVVNSKTALKISDTMCHLNTIQYSAMDDTLVFSNLQSSQIAKVKRSDGSTVWIMNGSTATVTGVTWSGGNHGIHMITPNNLILFNNNNNMATAGSTAFEITINGSTATKGWTYTASPAIANMVMGDVQKMPNGNVIVGYSTRGTLHEVSSTGTRLQEWRWASGAQFGYIEKRASLYGPPPK